MGLREAGRNSRKLLDVSRITALGWKPAIDLESGIESTYRWYLANRSIDGGEKRWVNLSMP